MKYLIVAGLAIVISAGGLVVAAPQASAGCMDAGWAGHPFAKMCDGPVDDGLWERCMSSFPNGPLNPKKPTATR